MHQLEDQDLHQRQLIHESALKLHQYLVILYHQILLPYH